MSTQNYIDPEQKDPKSFGRMLIDQRTLKKLSIKDVSGILKLESELILDMEAGDYSRLPRDLFGKGYLRSYARLLGLSEQMAADIYDLDVFGIVPNSPSIEEKVVADSPSEPGHRRASVMAGVGGVVLVTAALVSFMDIF